MMNIDLEIKKNDEAVTYAGRAVTVLDWIPAMIVFFIKAQFPVRK